MDKLNGGRGGFKARKTPIKIYPASPANTAASTEVLYHSMDSTLLEQAESAFGDQVVTSQILYKPAILAGARVNFHGNRWQLHVEKDILRIVPFPAKHELPEWNTNLNPNWNQQNARTQAEPESFFLYDSTFDFSAERFEDLQEDFRNHLISTVSLNVEYNPHFKLERGSDESPDSFMSRCMERARLEFDTESRNAVETMQRLEDRLKQRLGRELMEVESEGQSEIETHDSNIAIKEIKKEMERVTDLRKTRMNELEENLVRIAGEREQDVLRIHLSNITLLRFALIWLPYAEYVIQEKDSRRLELVQAFCR